MSVPVTPQGRQLSFSYGDERIEFLRTPRQEVASRIKIKVHPDCRVVVAAPVDASDSEVLAAVKKRGRWIYEQLRDFRKQLEHIRPRKYVSGESHYYLGKQYLLKVVVSPSQVQGVKLFRGKLEVTVRQNDSEKVRDLLWEWYKTRAREVFSLRLGTMLNQALWVSGRPSLRLRAMKSQWGSCSPSGRLTLNPHLIKAPRECIDYVILHELCHIAEHNHSERFYRLMKRVMPNWESVKEQLDGMAFRIINDNSF